VPASKGGADIKASRFCLQCWDKHGQTFQAFGFARIKAEDPCQFGFLNLIHYVLKQHAWYRDQDRYEFLETELRMHLLAKRALIARVISKSPKTVRAYVRTALLNKLQDLQADDATEFQVQTNSIEQELLDVDKCLINGEIIEQEAEFDSSDESQITGQIVDATGHVRSSVDSEDDGTADARSHSAARSVTAKCLIESTEQPTNAKDPLRRVIGPTTIDREKENAELVRAAIEEQEHRIDALTDLTQKEHAREVSKAHKQLLAAVDALPHDEQTVMRMRFLDGQALRKGKPRPRADIVRELRINGNGNSHLSEWDLRMLEQQAVLRLRGKIKLPAVFQHRD